MKRVSTVAAQASGKSHNRSYPSGRIRAVSPAGFCMLDETGTIRWNSGIGMDCDLRRCMLKWQSGEGLAC